jgi:hypothetical protein
MNGALVNLLVSLGLLVVPGPKDRPLMETLVNDHPLRLQIDTGAELLMLFSYAADRIGLPYQKPPQPADPDPQKPAHYTVYPSDLCRVKMGDRNVQIRLPICEVPPWVRSAGIDGVVGWPVIKNSVVRIDWGQKILEPVPEVPAAATQWQQFDVYTAPGLRVLALQVSESSESPRAVYIDTGSSVSVEVATPLWQEILSRHPGLSTTLEASYNPGIGYSASPVCWLPVLKLGKLELHDVPVSEASKDFQRAPAYLARISLYGLTRLELVVEARQNRAYVRPKQDYPKRYDYNRAGAVFLPADHQSDDLLARVLDGGPAYEAGIRNGDKLLRANEREVAGWRTDPNGWMSDTSTFEQAAGTKVSLTIMRDTCPMDVTVVLTEILPVEATAPASQKDQVNQARKETP